MSGGIRHLDQTAHTDTADIDSESAKKKARITAAEQLLTFQVTQPQQRPNEVLLYLQEPTPNINTNPLEWWEKNGTRYSRLLTVALKYLGIPATSVPPERIFSKAGEIVSRRRASLHPSTVDMLVHLSKNADLLTC